MLFRRKQTPCDWVEYFPTAKESNATSEIERAHGKRKSKVNMACLHAHMLVACRIINKQECDVFENVTSLPARPPARLPACPPARLPACLMTKSLISSRFFAQEAHDTTSQFTTRLECVLHFVALITQLQPDIWSMYKPFKHPWKYSYDMEYKKPNRTFFFKMCRNTSSFQQQDKHGILLWLVPSSTGFT